MVVTAGVSKWFVLAALLAVLWLARGVLPPFIIAGMLAYILSPLVDRLSERTGVRRALVALGVFVLVLLVVVGLVWLAGARLNSELRAMAREGPSIIGSVVERFTSGQSIDLLGQSISSADLAQRLDTAMRDMLGTPSRAIEAVRVAFDLTLSVILVFLSFAYMLVDGHTFWAYLVRFIPPEHRANVDEISMEIHRVLGRWLQGQLMLIALMSTVTFVILEWAFRLPYALWIGILTGVLEVIPLIGPVTAAVIACTVGFSHGGPSQAASLAVLYVILRQIEDQLVMPIVVGRAVHVHPLVTIFAVLVGSQIAGILGMILAVPITAAVKVVLDYAYPTRPPQVLKRNEPVLKPTPEVVRP